MDANLLQTYTCREVWTMVVHCPQCREAIRMSALDAPQRVVRYLCPNCDEIVAIDLVLDEVKGSGASSSYERASRTRTILVADDSRASGEVIAGILRQEGYVARTVRDGHSALDVIREIHPDLVILDLMLPGLSGIDVLRELRSEPRLQDTPVVVIGSVCKPEVVHYLNELGAAGFLDRDQLVETLVFRVRTILEGQPEPAGAAAGGDE